jgi:uncharacterized protein YjbI with pentapeptide repeats
MAKEEHLSILELGMEAWNAWREGHRGEEVDLTEADLEKRNLEGFDFSHVNLDRANLSGARLGRANFSSARLKNANLSHANLDHANLAHAVLDKAQLTLARIENGVLFFASLEGADLRGAHLKQASFEDANLRRTSFGHAHLESSVLAFSDCTGADFVSADLSGANLTAANLDKANVSAVKFDHSIFWKLVKKERFNPARIWKRRFDFLLDTTLRCKGVHAACYGSQRFTGFLKGQDFLEELMETKKGRMICILWWLFADCGRSFLRWALWSFAIILLFAFAYLLVGAQSYHLITVRFGMGTMLYYSVVNFSTLGFGDIVPCTPMTLFLTGLEVFTGYFMMGGLISIFATKVARTAR